MKDRLLHNFGVCTDEVHSDLETALGVAKELGMRSVELYEFWGKPVVAMDEGEIDRARDLLDQFELSVSAIGSLFLKLVLIGNVPIGRIPDHSAFQEDLKILKASIRVAKRVGAPVVRTYSFRRESMVGRGNPSPRLPQGGEIPDEMLERIVEGLRIAGDETAEAGLVLGLENVRSCWGNTGINLARIIRAADHPSIRAIWDPSNDYVSGGKPLPDGYEAVKPFICHMHVKDARVVDDKTGLTSWKSVGNGEVDYVGQFKALRRDGYAGTLSLETHWHPPTAGGGEPDRVADSRMSFAGVRAALRSSLES
jgi:sugar phosphate isomerase/epimerase